MDEYVQTELPDGYYIHSIDLEFDGEFGSDGRGWGYDASKSTHTISKYSIWLIKNDDKGNPSKSMFLVTIPNKQVYIYENDEWYDVLGKEEGPIIKR